VDLTISITQTSQSKVSVNKISFTKIKKRKKKNNLFIFDQNYPIQKDFPELEITYVLTGWKTICWTYQFLCVSCIKNIYFHLYNSFYCIRDQTYLSIRNYVHLTNKKMKNMLNIYIFQNSMTNARYNSFSIMAFIFFIITCKSGFHYSNILMFLLISEIYIINQKKKMKVYIIKYIL